MSCKSLVIALLLASSPVASALAAAPAAQARAPCAIDRSQSMPTAPLLAWQRVGAPAQQQV